MRGLKKACSDLIKQVDKYYSKESALKQAKIKLLKGEVPEEHLKVNLSTQYGVCLSCICASDFYNFVLEIPEITEWRSVLYPDKEKVYECKDYFWEDTDSANVSFDVKLLYDALELRLDEHRWFCNHNIVAEFGRLQIGYYLYHYHPSCVEKYHLVGLVDDEIVFMFVVDAEAEYGDCGFCVDLVGEFLKFRIPSTREVDDFSDVGLDNCYTLYVRLSDYSVANYLDNLITDSCPYSHDDWLATNDLY